MFVQSCDGRAALVRTFVWHFCRLPGGRTKTHEGAAKCETLLVRSEMTVARTFIRERSLELLKNKGEKKDRYALRLGTGDIIIAFYIILSF